MSSPVYPPNHNAGAGPSSSRSGHYRPATIAELAAQAQENLWDPSKGLKHWLRTAEKSRRNAEALVQEGNFEGAFVEYAKAATIVLEKLPTHREYQTLLNADQRHNLGMNGQDILDSLSQLKPILVERYESWQSSQRSSPGSSRPASTDPHLSREEERAREAREAARREEAWKQEDYVRRQAEERERQAREEAAWRQSQERSSLTERQRRDEENRRYAAEETKREEERARKKATDERRRQAHEAIVQRQQESEAAARAARRDIARLTPSPVPPSTASSSMRMPEPDRPSGRPVYAPQPSRPAEPYTSTSGLMPLESPNKYEDDSSTDVEGTKTSWRAQRSADQTPRSRQALGGPPHVPITTTSPAPPELGSIKYPSLMSQHQLKQGYVPSLQSIGLYNNILPSQSAPVAPVIPPYPTHMPVPESHQPHQPHQPPATYVPSHPQAYSSQRGPSPNGARPSQPSQHRPSASSSSSRIVPGTSKDAQLRELRTIKLPREVLSKFLSIARVNTLQNRETCGLLLGKDKGSKYVVTTLLIPKQHSTSDTCMMDEEELVLQFTEDRQLITLGWIHTHPTQSCFMSSVDLHTHSGFQRMLPESFAVVCAPSSTPQFGIFRLTDPGGLQTILECNAKEAFHPHPDVPIYTDCDNSHVQMKDLALEIVDLRN
ncbi:hypothetical protein C8Q76DRAFT_750732 [Earliella scabrosa]|nr:hypothetical protein C8Q76DRAFT_750732 [Earliella scabrosa]